MTLDTFFFCVFREPAAIFCRSFLPERTLPLDATATRSALFNGRHAAVERTSALVVRLPAKVQPGRLDLPKSATAPHAVSNVSLP